MKGVPRLSLFTGPEAPCPATAESEKVSFKQFDQKTRHRIKYAEVDADTGEQVVNEDIVKGEKVDIAASITARLLRDPLIICAASPDAAQRT